MITKATEICAICGKPKQEIHHLVFGRGMRELSDQDGLTITLCHDCHESVHRYAGAWSKMVGQLSFELDRMEKGFSREEAKGEFLKRYGRMYL